MPSAPAPAGPDSAGAARPRRAGAWRRLRLAAILLPLVAVALVAAYLKLALAYSFSTGDRAGYVQKFSRKGWVCKTWEGELAMVSLPGSAPEIFAFSVRERTVAAAINKHLGERVALSYEQHPGLPRCFGETEYFVTAVRAAGR